MESQNTTEPDNRDSPKRQEEGGGEHKNQVNDEETKEVGQPARQKESVTTQGEYQQDEEQTKMENPDQKLLEPKVEEENASVAPAVLQARRAQSPQRVRADDHTPIDVLFGRGVPIQRNPGNIRMHRIVDSYRQQYRTSSRSDKTVLVRAAIQDIKEGGARFLRRLGENESGADGDVWVEVDDDAVYEKISHALRGNGSSRSGTRREPAAASAAQQPRHAQDSMSPSSTAEPNKSGPGSSPSAASLPPTNPLLASLLGFSADRTLVPGQNERAALSDSAAARPLGLQSQSLQNQILLQSLLNSSAARAEGGLGSLLLSPSLNLFGRGSLGAGLNVNALLGLSSPHLQASASTCHTANLNPLTLAHLLNQQQQQQQQQQALSQGHQDFQMLQLLEAELAQRRAAILSGLTPSAAPQGSTDSNLLLNLLLSQSNPQSSPATPAPPSPSKKN